MKPLTICRPTETSKSFLTTSILFGLEVARSVEVMVLNESEVAFDALGKREDTKRVAFAHHQQTGGLVKKERRKKR